MRRIAPKITLYFLTIFMVASLALGQERFDNKTVTFTDVEGNLHKEVQLISADSEGLSINDHGSIYTILYENLSPTDLEAMGVARDHIDLALKAQRGRQALIEEERARTRNLIRIVAGTVALIVAVALLVTIISKLRAKRLRQRNELLAQRYDELVRQNGSFDDAAADELSRQAICLGMDPSVVSQLRQQRFLCEVQPIKDKIAKSLMLTDEDSAEIERIGHKNKIKVEYDETMALCRSIFLIERDKSLPPPIETDLLLGGGEAVYAVVPSTWQEPRIVSQGYAGGSISIPTGLEGVRFSFGSYSPIQTEQVTTLARGCLYVTSERLLFRGESRNTDIKLKRIVNGQIYFDEPSSNLLTHDIFRPRTGAISGLRVEKNTGRPDYFSMSVVQARYLLSLIGGLRNHES